MKRISILLMSFLIFSTTSVVSAQEVLKSEVSTTSTSISGTSTEILKASTSTENIHKDFSLIFSDKIDEIKKQFDAYILRISFVNQKISNNIEILSESKLNTEDISEIVAESNSALEKSKVHLNNISEINKLNSEDVISFVNNAKNELGLAKNEIRKAQELGKIAISKIKIMVLENSPNSK